MEPTQGHTSRSRGSTREVFAWVMYDWANSAFSTLSITVVMLYLRDVVLPGGTGEVAYAWAIASSMLVAAILSPIVGAMADARSNKRTWLTWTAMTGAALASAIAILPPQEYVPIVVVFFLTCLCFELSLGFYNGFLPEIADEDTMNRVSSWGYGAGYVGGGIALLGALAMMNFLSSRTMPESTQLRAAIFIMAAWWGLFTLPVVYWIRDHRTARRDREPIKQAVRQAISEVGSTLRNIRAFRTLAIFLLGFLFFNDGIQTVISQAGLFGRKELGFEATEIIVLILVVQFIALPGALAIGWISDRAGQKPTLMVCLTVWVGLLVAAWFVHSKVTFWVLAVVLALVIGGTQSVSRAIMAMMTPPSRTAEFFGFFNFSGKATSWMGTSTFGLVIFLTDNARFAILSLLIFFLIGWALTATVNVARGRREAIEAG